MGKLSLQPRTARATDSDKLHQRRAFLSVAVLGDYLYIEGGEQSHYLDSGKKGTDSNGNEFNTDAGADQAVTQFIPVNQRWAPQDVQFDTISHEVSDMKMVNFPSFWAIGSTLYRWGGQLSNGLQYAEGDKPYLFSVLPVSGGGSGLAWTKSPIPDSNQLTGANMASAPCDDTGFTYGGYAYKATMYAEFDDTRHISGMLMERVCLPGVLNYSIVAVMGGADLETAQYRAFTNFTFYDPYLDRWYYQKTINPPSPMDDFCVVGIQSTHGTYEIFLYGGIDQSGKVSSDIWVLSLPLFRWFRYTLNASEPRSNHACAIAGKRQMISVGGIDRTNSSDAWTSQDPWYNTLGVFDLAELKWKDVYDPNLGDYSTPTEIWSYYTDQALEQIKWDMAEVENIFMAPYYEKNPKGSQPGNDTTSNNTNNGKSEPAGAIAGGVVGGVVGVAAISALVWFFFRRRRSVVTGRDQSSPWEDYSNQQAKSWPQLLRLTRAQAMSFIPQQSWQSLRVARRAMCI
uniref:Kelch repeat protein n=1 Tax=Bionectria ochroleuca TaxID=29856 RepID=A0A8H7K4M4_BIOOC